MIEKRTMWLMESSLKVRQIVALFDVEKNEIICYRYRNDDGTTDDDDDWYHVYPGETFYNTEGEAKESLQRKIAELKEKMKTCLSIIKELDCINPSDDFKFKREDYLGHYAHDKSESDFWERRRKNAEKESGLLNSIARSRHFNVAGETINIDEVVRVLWHDNDDNEKATLVMRDGHKVRTYSEPEYNVVVGMFGSNRSDRYIPLV